MKVCLSTKGIQNIPYDLYEKDFVFIIGGKKIRINRFFADFISPKIAQYHKIDPTLSSFTIDEDMSDLATNENSNKEKRKAIITKDILEEFMEIAKGKTIEIEVNKLEAYAKLSTILQNKEIFEQIENYFSDINEINIDDSILTLQMIDQRQDNINATLKLKENIAVDFLCSHFYEILKSNKARNEIKQLKTDTINKIISKENLIIEDENDLFDFIIELIEIKKENTILLENILFDMVSETEFDMLIPIFDPNEMTAEIWSKISKCFRPKMRYNRENERETETLKEHRYLTKFKLFPFIDNDRFDGILSYLTMKSGGNIHKNGTIEVTSSSTAGKLYSPENVIINKNNKSMFLSKDEENSWICFDFKERRVKLSYYTITSRYYSNEFQPLSWVIEGSDNQENWQIINEKPRGDRGDFHQALQNLSFSVENPQGYFRYIRLRQTSQNSSFCYCLNFTAIEFYGNLRE